MNVISPAQSPWLPALLLLVAVPLGAQDPVGPTQSELRNADPGQWLHAARNYEGDRFVDLAAVNRENAESLRPVCVFQAASDRAFYTNPLVYGETMYLTTRHDVIALDARTCEVRWRWTWDASGTARAQANRGVALKDGKVVTAAADGRLLALDAATGQVLWERKVADRARGESFSMPPLVYEDMIIIGPAGSESGIAGWIGGFRLSDGEPVWRFHIVPRPGEPGSETWGEGVVLEYGGGGVWTPLMLDPARGHVYVGTANPAPDFDGSLRPGANLYTNSLVVLDARTGELQWYKQTVPHDVHDRGVTAPGPLYTARVEGRDRPLVATAGKDGVLRVYDRETHQLVFDRPVTRQHNTDRAPTLDGVRVCPGMLGGVQWNAPAYHPGHNLLYVPSVEWCSTYRLGGHPREWWSPYFGGTFELDPVERSRGWLTAVDASTGEVRWRYEAERPMVAAVTAKAGDVLFTGEITGDFLALDAETGRVLYRFQTGGSVAGGIPTYEIDGKQYVAVTSGGMTPFWERPPGSATVLVFSLP